MIEKIDIEAMLEDVLTEQARWHHDYLDAAKEKLISAFEALEAEVERTRWHYPDRGELPPHDAEFIAECSFDSKTPDELDYVRVRTWRNNHWITADTYIVLREITRWRYV